MIPSYFDKYTARARLAPCLIVALPLAAASLPYYDNSYGWGFFSLFFVQISIAVLISQFCRDAGKKAEDEIFGDRLPHIRLLRFSDDQYSEQKKKRIHDTLLSCCFCGSISAEEERNNPERADNIYSLWCEWLKQYVRTKDHFYLVREENSNYGFRRNLYGLKKIWALSILCGLIIFSANLTINTLIRAENIVTFLLIACNILSWCCVTKKWVTMAAHEYASQLHLAALAIPFPENGK